jgi:hypothetical protein
MSQGPAVSLFWELVAAGDNRVKPAQITARRTEAMIYILLNGCCPAGLELVAILHACAGGIRPVSFSKCSKVLLPTALRTVGQVILWLGHLIAYYLCTRGLQPLKVVEVCKK